MTEAVVADTGRNNFLMPPRHAKTHNYFPTKNTSYEEVDDSHTDASHQNIEIFFTKSSNSNMKIGIVTPDVILPTHSPYADILGKMVISLQKLSDRKDLGVSLSTLQEYTCPPNKPHLDIKEEFFT